MTKRQIPALPVCQRCSAPVETDTDLCVQCLCEDLGITYRQLDYWTREGLLRPAWQRAEPGMTSPGQGGRSRTWGAEERRVACLMGRLTAAGIAPRVAERLARAEGGRCEIAPGIWIQVEEVPGD